MKLDNDSRNRFKDRTKSISNNNFNTIQTNAQESTQAHSTSNFGGRKLKTNRSSTRNNKIELNTKRSHIIDSYNSQYDKFNTLQSSAIKRHSIGPGPGSYNF